MSIHVLTSEYDKAYPIAEFEYEQVSQSSHIFWESFHSFQRSFNTNSLAPEVGGKPLDLHRLFVEVTSRGGIQKVIQERMWKEVTVVFDIPAIASASFVLRKHYLSLLYHFEQVYYFHKKAPSISNADVFSRNPSFQSEAVNFFEEDSPKLQIGHTFTGNIDGKFDNGYIVSMNLGMNELKGVLYHIPTHYCNYTEAEKLGSHGKETCEMEMLEDKSTSEFD